MSSCRSYILILLTGIVLSLGLYYAFVITPNEVTMGPVMRIMYFHVGSAIAAYSAFAAVFCFSLFYAASKKSLWDVYQEAAAEVALVFCSTGLLSGMIWGHSAWNTWFRWEPRLVSFLFLWMIAASLFLLRHFGDDKNSANHAAVLGIVGGITVPIVMFSVRMLPKVVQLHPQKVSLDGPGMKEGLSIATVSMVLLGLVLVLLRSRIGMKERSELQ